MYKKVLFLCLIISSALPAQNLFKSPELYVEADSILREKIYNSLDALYAQIMDGDIDDKYILPEHSGLTKSVFTYLTEIENNEESNSLNNFKKELINFYPIVPDKFNLDIAHTGNNKKESYTGIRIIHNLLAEEINKEIKFSIPLSHITSTWKTIAIGKIKYHYRDSINIQNAQLFSSQNHLMAEKLGVTAESFNFYICENYQEIMMLLGIKYDLSKNGQIADGYGVDSGNIFSIQANEDFSHDLFHYYSGKVNEFEKRNWVAEEGIAYSWGNAYYVDSKGKMIHQNLLVRELKIYLDTYPETSLLELFEEDKKIFNHLSSKISVRSTLSSLLCDEIERQKGIHGIFEIINSGRTLGVLENFLQNLDRLIAINRHNFDREVIRLILKY